MKHVKELLISNEIANQDNENTLKSVKGSILWLPCQQGQIFKRFKFNDKFINMSNQFDNSNVINSINKIIVGLKMYEKRKII